MDLPRNLDPACCVAREHGGGKAVLGIVSELDCVRFVAGPDHAHDGAEALFAEQLHVRSDFVDQMRGHQHVLGGVTAD